MPPTLQVQTLYSSCLNAVFELLFNSVQISHGTEEIRKFIQRSLHVGIREHLVHVCTSLCRDNMDVMMDLLSVLLDNSIRKLDITGGDDNLWLRAEECRNLFTVLEQCDVTGLHQLIVKVRLDPPHIGRGKNSHNYLNLMFHRVLNCGLATNLKQLTLHFVCDNTILGLLGQNCPFLTHLDATSSWLVDDRGIVQLCFKDPDIYMSVTNNAYSSVREFFSNESIFKNDSDLTACSKSLHEVRIQDTNTSEIGVLLLLMFLPNLKSLGGFIYYRNVGDVVANLLKCSSDADEFTLSLTDLWDTCISHDKAQLINTAAPDLCSLYTRGSCLHNVVIFNNLTSLTVDFDFVDLSLALEQYLNYRGENIKKLVLVDQIHPVNLGTLARLCPFLVELNAKVCGNLIDEAESCLQHLDTCRVRISSTDTFYSILVHAQNLSHFEVILEEERYGDIVDGFDDTLLSQVLTEAPILSNLRVLLIRSECDLTYQAVQMLFIACPSLRVIGELHKWHISDRDIEYLSNEIRRRNFDLALGYRGMIYPRRRRCIMSK